MFRYMYLEIHEVKIECNLLLIYCIQVEHAFERLPPLPLSYLARYSPMYLISHIHANHTRYIQIHISCVTHMYLECRTKYRSLLFLF